MSPTIRIIAAVDFGTHGTGFAWAFASERDREPKARRILLHEDWAAQPIVYVKNLTALLLDGSGTVLEWGYQAQERYLVESRTRPDLDYYQRFKMGLLPSPEPTGDGPAGPGRSAEELIVAYLREFYRFSLSIIIAGSGVAEDEILWCVTVPAIWRDRERQVMRDCAVASGFPSGHERLLIAVEPEVAALYCRYETGRDVDAAGSRFMVVDAGGGTVDITSYEVGPAGLREIGYTSGGSHGSTYIDQFLRDRVLAPRLGPEVLKRASDLDPGVLVALMSEWERAKCAHDPAHQRPIVLTIPNRLLRLIDKDTRARLADAQEGIDDELRLSPEEVSSLFDLTVDPILRLVDEQLRRVGGSSIGKVLLVGGFAQSKYLQRALRSHLRSRTELVVPGRPSWAVLLGAVHYGLDPGAIRGRRSRFTYGVAWAAPFDHFRDPPHLGVTNDAGALLCNQRFDVFVRAGDVVEPGTIVTREYAPLRGDQASMSLGFHTGTDAEPRYVTDQGVEPVGELNLDMSGTLHRPVDERIVEVRLTFGGTEIEAHARDRSTGHEVTTSLRFARKV